MSDWKLKLRLFNAVVVALLSCIVVWFYTWAASISLASPERRFPPAVAWLLLNYSGYAFVCPLMLLLFGTWFVRLPTAETRLELLIAGAWIFAISWTGYALLAWLLA